MEENGDGQVDLTFDIEDMNRWERENNVYTGRNRGEQVSKKIEMGDSCGLAPYIQTIVSVLSRVPNNILIICDEFERREERCELIDAVMVQRGRDSQVLVQEYYKKLWKDGKVNVEAVAIDYCAGKADALKKDDLEIDDKELFDQIQQSGRDRMPQLFVDLAEGLKDCKKVYMT